MTKLRVLVTNDDGVRSLGLTTLVHRLANEGHDVLVVAPDTDCTGSGGAIGRVHDGAAIAVELVHDPAVPCVPIYGLRSTPAMCVLSACLGAYGPAPDVVVAGINAGANVGGSLLHSGTVAAALTGAGRGLRGIAVSNAAANGTWWSTAAEVASFALPWLMAQSERTVINVNVPDRPLSDIKGVRSAPLAPLSRLRTTLVTEGCGAHHVALSIASAAPAPDSDAAFLSQGWVTVTGLSGIRAVDIDMSGLQPAATR